ncbi:MAG TPA: hypothetical protein VJK54_04630, partial [Chthoniobacterales bacterium]|nr:hypothetical protein [Chthoniobacterales bacterium]
MQNKIGEATFTEAANAQSEEVWVKAYHEALELEGLWKEMAETNREEALTATPEEKMHLLVNANSAIAQQTAWEKRAAIAQAKAAFVKTKNLWIPLTDAVKTFVENPNFDTDFQNATTVIETAEDFFREVEKTSILVGKTTVPNTVKALTQIKLAVRNIANAAKVATNAKGSVSIATLVDVAKDTISKTAAAMKSVEVVWKEEVTWIAEVTREAATSAKNMVIRQGSSGIVSPFNMPGIQESKAPNIIHKHYHTYIRYMRARKNIVEKILEPQKKALASERKSLTKKEKEWKGKKGLVDARKKLATQSKAKASEITPSLKKTADQNNQEPSISSVPDQTSFVLKTEPTEESIADSHGLQINIFEDIATEENQVTQERIVLDQEHVVLEKKEEDIQVKETALARLDEKSNIVRTQEVALAQEKEKLASERAVFEKQREQNLTDQGALAQLLLQREAAMKAEEMRIALEREALAKNAESQEALVDYGGWILIHEKLDILIELEKNAVMNAEAADIQNVEKAWKKARNIALDIAALWDKVIQNDEKRMESSISPVEKKRLLVEIKNARNEKLSWNDKAAEWARRAAEDRTVIRANATNVNTYLEDEICNSIYRACLAKVAADL